MGKTFWKYVETTKVFFFVRFLATIVVALIYIILAAFIQYYFVKFFGENTFNYIIGGMLSLFIGILFCHYIGSLFFMFVKGWHVAALAYTNKIRKAGVSAFDVGVKAFNKNIVSFGAVYGLRTLLNNILTSFKTRLWDITSDIPYFTLLRRAANNPIVEYLAGDVLHYAFDATIFYIVKKSPDSLSDIPELGLEAVKKYLYAIPAILVSSVQSFMIFRFVPKVIKWLVIFYIFLHNGFLAGILISVLMYPIFYILDNALFDPLTMIVFISAYAKKCKEEVDESNPIVVAVNQILEGDEPRGEEGEEELEGMVSMPEEESTKADTKKVESPATTTKEPAVEKVETGGSQKITMASLEEDNDEGIDITDLLSGDVTLPGSGGIDLSQLAGQLGLTPPSGPRVHDSVAEPASDAVEKSSSPVSSDIPVTDAFETAKPLSPDKIRQAQLQKFAALSKASKLNLDEDPLDS